MRLRTIHVVALLATGFGFCQNAWADNTRPFEYTIKFTSETAYTTSGKICRGGTVIVETDPANPDNPIAFTVYESDGTTVIITGTVTPATPKSGTITQLGKPLICTPVPFSRAETCTELDEVTTDCDSIPTLSEWAVVAMVLLLLAAGTIVFGRSQRPSIASS